MKILHTADLHLGATFAFLGEKGTQQRHQLLRTFERVVELALQEGVDLVLICGDLFDSNAPAPALVERVSSLLGQLDRSAIPCCIIPGTHDWFGPQSIYRAVDLAAGRPGVTVFRESRGVLFSALGLAVHGVVPSTKTLAGDPFDLIVPHPDARVQLAMIHGSLYTPGQVESDDVLLHAESIARSGLDYLALGHWHDYRELAFQRTKVVYSGAPELTAAKHANAGQVALVEIAAPGAVTVRPIAVGRRRYHEVPVDVDALAGVDDLRAAIRAFADPDLVLQVNLRGLWSVATEVDPPALEEELALLFFHLRIRDAAHAAVGVIAADAPSTTVKGRYVALLRERMDTLAGEELALHEEALRLGLAVLDGRQVLQ